MIIRVFAFIILAGLQTHCFGQNEFYVLSSSSINLKHGVNLFTFPNYKLVFSIDSNSFHQFGDQCRNDFFTSIKSYNVLSARQSQEGPLVNSTLLRYQLGSKTSQRLQVAHFQKLAINSSFGLNADVGSTKGYYPFQSEYFKNFNPSIGNSFFRERYSVKFSYEASLLKRGENGGLKDANGFISNGISDERTIPVRMNDAYTEYFSKSIILDQLLKLPEASSDSIVTNDFFAFRNITLWNSEKKKFSTGKIYNELFINSYLDTISTNDSTQIKELSNHAKAEYNLSTLLNFNSYKRDIYLTLDVGFQLLELKLNEKAISSFSLFQLEPGIAYRTEKVNSLIYFISKVYNRLNNGFGGGVDVAYKFQSSFLSFSASSQDSCPPLFYFHTYSNHFIWERDYKSIRDYRVQLNYQRIWNSKLKTSIGIKVHHWKNHHFLNSNSEPEVFNKAISLIQSCLLAEYNLKQWKLIGETRMQDSNYKSLIRQPEYIQFFQVLFGDSVFKSKAWLQTGPGIFFVSGYALPSFNPALQEFYNGEEKKSKAFYQLRYSTQLTINRAEIYFTVEHLNAGWSNRNYFYAVDYALPGRMIKFGIKWLLEN